MRAEKIYLIGFMAAGKSSLARALAERLKWHVEDIDDRIEVREHKTISELFSQRGESYFRMVERAILTEMLPLNHTVIATGGGTFVDPDNQAAINGNGASIWIDVPLAQIISRLSPDKRRPLASTRAQLEQVYALRQSAYAQAHLRLDGSGAPIGELADRVVDWLGS
jgi:shikimate kinase